MPLLIKASYGQWYQAENMYAFGVFEFTTDLFQSHEVDLIHKTLSIELLDTPDVKKPF